MSDSQQIRAKHDAMILQAREWEEKANELYLKAHMFCQERVIPAEQKELSRE